MQLRDYLRLEGEQPFDFAQRTGVTIHAVRKWIDRTRTPRPSTILKIQEVTKGAVTANDWLPKH